MDQAKYEKFVNEEILPDYKVVLSSLAMVLTASMTTGGQFIIQKLHRKRGNQVETKKLGKAGKLLQAAWDVFLIWDIVSEATSMLDARDSFVKTHEDDFNTMMEAFVLIPRDYKGPIASIGVPADVMALLLFVLQEGPANDDLVTNLSAQIAGLVKEKGVKALSTDMLIVSFTSESDLANFVESATRIKQDLSQKSDLDLGVITPVVIATTIMTHANKFPKSIGKLLSTLGG